MSPDLKGLKVLHLIDSGGLYGAEKMLLSLVKEQISKGLKPMILSAGEPDTDEKPLEREARRLQLPITIWRMKPGLNLNEAHKIANWANAENYKILHSHGYKFNILMSLLSKRSLNLPIVTTLHGYVKSKFPTKMWFYELLDRFALVRMDRVVLVRSGMENDIGFLYRYMAIRKVNNGINVEEIDRLKYCLIDSDIKNKIVLFKPLIGAVGRLSSEKGHLVLIEAFSDLLKKFPHAGLIIVGEGEERTFLENKIIANGIEDKVLLIGYRENIPSILMHLDILVMPSKTEGLPLTLLEAMVVGTSVVASSVGGIPTLLEKGRLGYLTAPNDVNNLRVVLCRCLDDSADRRSKREEAKSTIIEHYSSARMSDEYCLIYAELVK